MTGNGQRDRLIESHLNLVRTIARKMIVTLPPCFELDELISAGNVGLIVAATKFDPGRKVQFAQYAHRRIKGAMLDSIRRKNWDAATSPPLEDLTTEPGHDPSTVTDITREQLATKVVVCINELPARERKLIVDHYFEGRHLAEAGRDIGVGTTRTTQIHAEALRKLKISLHRRNVDRAA